MINPDNYVNPYGIDPLYGSTATYGGIYNGTGQVEQYRVFLQQQKCESFQITVTEIFDPQFGTMPGAGLTLSGLDVLVGTKGKPRLNPSRSVG